MLAPEMFINKQITNHNIINVVPILSIQKYRHSKAVTKNNRVSLFTFQPIYHRLPYKLANSSQSTFNETRSRDFDAITFFDIFVSLPFSMGKYLASLSYLLIL